VSRLIRPHILSRLYCPLLSCRERFADVLCAVRSEGGLECQKVQAELPANSVDESGAIAAGMVSADYSLLTKSESDWGAGGLMM
jgi:hypothetical protein